MIDSLRETEQKDCVRCHDAKAILCMACSDDKAERTVRTRLLAEGRGEASLCEKVKEEIDALMDNADYDCETNRCVARDRIIALLSAARDNAGLPDDKEIDQVACDEAQQDWNRPEFSGIYEDGYKAGAKWMRDKARSRGDDAGLREKLCEAFRNGAACVNGRCLSDLQVETAMLQYYPVQPIAFVKRAPPADASKKARPDYHSTLARLWMAGEDLLLSEALCGREAMDEFSAAMREATNVLGPHPEPDKINTADTVALQKGEAIKDLSCGIDLFPDDPPEPAAKECYACCEPVENSLSHWFVDHGKVYYLCDKCWAERDHSLSPEPAAPKRWISVKDGLPKISKNMNASVLSYSKHGIEISYYGICLDLGWNDGNYFFDYNFGRWNKNNDVTHWMPLPEPPAVEEEP
ncbi:MAG: DUF551 domain-containing protein [Dehalococcoidia bacterium]|jgi:hypothetical protein